MRNDVLTGVRELKPIAEQAGLTMPQLAVAWVLQNPNVASAIIGASRPEQIADTGAQKEERGWGAGPLPEDRAGRSGTHGCDTADLDCSHLGQILKPCRFP